VAGETDLSPPPGSQLEWNLLLSCKRRRFIMPRSIQWTTDVNAAFEQARRSSKPVLLDFSAAPM
jgi:hypothetical protein